MLVPSSSAARISAEYSATTGEMVDKGARVRRALGSDHSLRSTFLGLPLESASHRGPAPTPFLELFSKSATEARQCLKQTGDNSLERWRSCMSALGSNTAHTGNRREAQDGQQGSKSGELGAVKRLGRWASKVHQLSLPTAATSSGLPNKQYRRTFWLQWR